MYPFVSTTPSEVLFNGVNLILSPTPLYWFWVAIKTHWLVLNAGFYPVYALFGFGFFVPNQLDVTGLLANYYYLFLYASYILSSWTVFYRGLNSVFKEEFVKVTGGPVVVIPVFEVLIDENLFPGIIISSIFYIFNWSGVF